MTMYYFLMLLMLNYFMMMMMIFLLNLKESNLFIMGLFLMIYSLFICFEMNFLNLSYWYSYILFLVMVGGLMILFLYFVSLNNNFSLYKFSYFKIFLCMILSLFLFNKNSFFYLFMIFNSDSNESLFFIFKNKMIYLNLMMDLKMDLILYVIFYLFLTMILCSWISMKVSLPLRQIKN